MANKNFISSYIKFLNNCKTEFETLDYIERSLKKSGFSSFEGNLDKDRIFVKRGPMLFAAKIDTKEIKPFVGIGSHIDSPRLDLKPNFFKEDEDMLFFNTHYYGGIKKYQWVSRPLTLKGHVSSYVNGKMTKIPIDEINVSIPDLLPHLSKDQMKKSAKDFLSGEDLKPLSDIGKDIKKKILKDLEKKGFNKRNLSFSELRLVPSENVSEIGFKRDLISGYGQDDRICAFTSLEAFLKASKNPKYNQFAFFFDKEEIGSDGISGAKSFLFKDFIDEIYELLFLKNSTDKSFSKFAYNQILKKSFIISADVTAGYNPLFAKSHDKENAPFISKGPVISKYTGSGGKYFSSEAPSELCELISSKLDDNKISWQVGELGKLDEGGGGTIAVDLVQTGILVVDIGPALLSMHSPSEISAKSDVENSFKAYKLIYEIDDYV